MVFLEKIECISCAASGKTSLMLAALEKEVKNLLGQNSKKFLVSNDRLGW